MKTYWLPLLVAALTLPATENLQCEESRRISVHEYHDKVYAAWLGQIVGNIYGLSYEFKFIDEPGPDAFPYGFGESLERVQEVNGAFSDDDTDIEYMYLLRMEEHGIEPTYEQLAAAWKYHVRDRVWVANRNALTLMHAGYLPPLTGHRDLNPNWFQIDPQLVNEIWAVTAPGMIDYATAKSDWAARITNDGFGVEPTVHYAAMYAAAFFEKDIHKLIDIGTAALPEGGRFAAVVEHMKRLYREHPENWQAARNEMSKHYYGEFDYNRGAWAAVDAILNGAAGILALLYGEGNFQHTLDMASALGFDADNQAATMCGLLGIVNGTEGIPKELLFPLSGSEWSLPFNDRYINVSRHDLPDASIRDMARRTADQGEKIILAGGGRRLQDGGTEYLEINTQARFTAPFELPSAPTLLAEAGKPLRFPFWFGKDDTKLELLTPGDGHNGPGLQDGAIVFNPQEPGLFPVSVRARRGDQTRERTWQIRVHGRNLAPLADHVIYSRSETEDDIELIRDGRPRDATYYSRPDKDSAWQNYYGYHWDEPQTISTLVLNPGLPEEFGGWFTSLKVQFQSADGDWQDATLKSISPPMNFDPTQWLKGAFIDHSLSIEPVTTRAIRIIGDAGGIERDERTGGGVRYYTPISELADYAD